MSGTPPREPDDNERTVIRPSPGGRIPAPNGSVGDTGAKTLADRATIADPQFSPITNTKLSAAATPLLQLLARLHYLSRVPNTEDLRERVVQELRDFERRARQAGVPMELLRPAHYALCASIDDVVLNTPWGASGSWQARTLISSFHRNTDDGQQFFDILERLRKDPARFLPVIELMYLCLSLGFIGPYRPPRGDSARFDHIRNEVCTLIIHERRIADVPLSPQWKGIPARYRAHRRLVPVWVAIATAVAATGGLFAAVSAELNAGSDTIYARMLAAPPARMPSFLRVSRVQPPPAPPQTVGSTVIDRLKNALQAGIVSGHLTVLGTPSAPVVRIGNQGMFPAGSASPQATSIGLLEALGSALKAEQGTLQVIGYTDNQPIRTVQFPSNFQLSLARAQAVRAVIIHTLGDATRVTAEGRADADPIASNATAEGRELNRRIEIVLHRQDQQE